LHLCLSPKIFVFWYGEIAVFGGMAAGLICECIAYFVAAVHIHFGGVLAFFGRNAQHLMSYILLYYFGYLFSHTAAWNF